MKLISFLGVLMKTYFLVLICTIVLMNCSDKQNTEITDPTIDRPTRELLKLNYYTVPESQNKFSIILDNSGFTSGKVIVVTQNDSVSYFFNYKLYLGNYRFYASVNSNYLNQNVDLILELQKANNDTLYKFQINDYNHLYKSEFEITKLGEYTNGCYVYDKSISPDLSKIFYLEISGDLTKSILKCIDLNSYQIITVDDNFRPQTSFYNIAEISAVSSNELIVKTILYNYQAGSDSSDICRYNINNKQFIRIAHTSLNYSEMSSVVNNTILFGKPTGGENSTGIEYNFSTNQVTDITGYYYHFDNRLDNIWQGNSYYDEVSHQFIELPFNSENTYAYFYNRNNGYTITIYHPQVFSFPFYSQLRIYQNSQLLYEDNINKKKQIFFIDGRKNSESKLIVFISFSENQDIQNNGFYEVDLHQNSIKLIHSLNKPVEAFWINSKEFITFEEGGIFKYRISI